MLERLIHRNHNGSRHGAARKIAWTAGAASTAIAARASLPSLWTQVANFVLRKIPGYSAHIDHVDLNLFSGKLLIQGFALDQKVDHRDAPVARIDSVRVHASWKSVVRGRLVGDIEINKPRLWIDLPRLQQSQKPSPETTAPPSPAQNGKAPWQDKVKQLLPFQIQFTLTHGEAHVTGLPGQEKTDVTVQDIQLRIKNLTNSSKISGTLMAFAEAHMHVLSTGDLSLQANGYPLAEKPTFNVDLKLEHLNLPELRTFARHFGGLDIKQGVLEAYAEAAAKEGRLQGYIKPVIDRLSIDPVEHSFKDKTKANLASGVIALLQSRKEDRIATTLDFEGPLEHPDMDIFGATTSIFKNAFVRAVEARLDDRVWFQKMGPEETQAEVHYEKPSKSKFRVSTEMMSETFKRFSRDAVPRMAAALSYYTAFSIAPLLLLVVSIAGLAFGKEAAQGQIVGQLTGLVGEKSASAIQGMIQAANQPSKGIFASIVSLISLIAGASGVLSELKNALNHMWRTDEPSGIPALVKQNLRYFGIIFAIGFLLLVSLAASAAMAAVGKWMGGFLPLPEAVLHLLNFVVSFAIITLLFACLYKFLPNTWIAWKDVLIGSIVTSFLFTIGKMALGLYIGKSSIGSAYGSAGSILIVLMWVYYSGLIFYLGAEFTKVYADRFGTRAGQPGQIPQLKKES
jgi:membrane protein